MLLAWLTPLLTWFGIDLITLLVIVLIIVILIKL